MSSRWTCRTTRAQLRRGTCGALFGSLTVTLALAGCGQTGPLALPDAARPIERLDPSARAPEGEARPLGGAAQPGPGAAVGTTPPAQREPGKDDESDDPSDRSTGAPR